MSKGIGFSIADIQAARKTLTEVDCADQKDVQKSNDVESKETTNDLAALREIYNKYDGISTKLPFENALIIFIFR